MMSSDNVKESDRRAIFVALIVFWLITTTLPFSTISMPLVAFFTLRISDARKKLISYTDFWVILQLHMYITPLSGHGILIHSISIESTFRLFSADMDFHSLPTGASLAVASLASEFTHDILPGTALPSILRIRDFYNIS